MNPASPFQIGDLVEIIGTDDHGFGHTIGEKFKITQINRPNAPFQWASCVGRAIYPASSLRKVEELHVGDYAKVIGPAIAVGVVKSECGKIDRVTKINSDGGICVSGWYYPRSSLQKVDGPELKIGDWCEIIGPSYPCEDNHFGEVFQITQMPDMCRDIHGCRSDKDHYSREGLPMYPASSLRKLTPEEVAKHTTPMLELPREIRKKIATALLAQLTQLNEHEERLSAIESKLADLSPKDRTFPGDDCLACLYEGPWTIDISRGNVHLMNSGRDGGKLGEWARRMMQDDI